MTIKFSIYIIIGSIFISENLSAFKLPEQVITIINGHRVQLGERPYQVSLQRNGNHFCGGVIINNDVILTAAHCFDNVPDDETTVVAGITSLDGNNYQQIYTSQYANIKKVYIHPKFNSYSNTYDIAVIKLKSEFPFNNYVNSVDLPQSAFVATGVAQVSGWGAITEGGAFSDNLMKANLAIISRDQCHMMYGDDCDDTFFCASSAYGFGAEDACQGDSGGPLTCIDSENSNVILCGIISAGVGCGHWQAPGFYINVAHFIDWIKNVSNTLRN